MASTSYRLRRGIAGAAGAAADEYSKVLDQRHRLALERVKDKYSTAARKDQQAADLARDAQRQRERYRIAEYNVGAKEEAATLAHERGVAESEKQRAHEIELEKIRAAGRGRSGAGSARMSLITQVWENLKAVRPDEDPNELWLEAFKLTNEKKEMSPEAEIRNVWNTHYEAAMADPIFGKSEEEAKAMADEAAKAYRQKWFPDLRTSRERFKKKGGEYDPNPAEAPPPTVMEKKGKYSGLF